MKRIFTAIAAAAALTASAGAVTPAFDNSTCSTFFVGAWAGEMPPGYGGEKDHPGAALTFAFAEDGKATLTMTPTGEKTETSDMTWKTAPGAAADQCALTMTQEGWTERPQDTNVAIVKDGATFSLERERGAIEFKRQP